MLNELTALSPLDGRYRGIVEKLSTFFSESALIKHRLHIEVEWLIYLCNTISLPETSKLSSSEVTFLRKIVSNFTMEDATAIKLIEKTTNHDVKAVEYYLKNRIAANKKLKLLSEFIHFACTSEDINNTAYNLMIRGALSDIVIPLIKKCIDSMYSMAQKFADVAMLAHTHGQPASPTTVGKELINFVARLEREIKILESIPYLAKFSGAVGNFNAHVAAYPKLDWKKISAGFIKSLGISPNLYTAQIETHDSLATQFDSLTRLNTIFIDLTRDMWMYISYRYFKQKIKAGEVGSSTMPHKVNPIDFENAEGNLGLANAILKHFSEKLPISRMQRDLSDSTVMRNIGVALGYSVLAYTSLTKGLSKLEINTHVLLDDLADNVEVLAEAIQTVLRKYKIEGGYEQLKELTRDKKITLDSMHAFIKQLMIPDVDKKYLLSLSPATYTGLASQLTKEYKRL